MGRPVAPALEASLLAVDGELAEAVPVEARSGERRDAVERLRADGTVLPFPLSHAALGCFAAAKRSTISLAVRAT
jgi:hypothetical protein